MNQIAQATDIQRTRLWARVLLEYIDSLERADANRAREVVRQHVTRPSDLHAAYLSVLLPAEDERRRRLSLKELSQAEDHFWQMTTQTLIDDLSETLFSQAAANVKALVSCLPGESFAVEARVLADLLELDGFDTKLISAPLRAGEVIDELRRDDYGLAVLLTRSSLPRSLLMALAEAKPGIKLLIGGAGPPLDGPTCSPVTATFGDTATAVRLARALLPARADG